MDSSIAKRLIELNRRFYDQFGNSFSATRQRLQPGVKKILETIREDDSVLDLGCGNGHFLRELIRRGHKAPLLGVDFSLPLLRNAESTLGVEFREVDLTKLAVVSDQLSVIPYGDDVSYQLSPTGTMSVVSDQPLITDHWSLITAFATLHHIPSTEIRLDILRTVKKLLKPGGRFILSNWQFLNSEKLKARIQPWSRVGLSDEDVDEGDYLLDWRSGGEGLRYAHHFSAEELPGLAGQAGMSVSESFLSDGENGRLGLYQVWKSEIR